MTRKTKTTPKKTKTATRRASKLAPAPQGLSLLLSFIDVGNENDAIYARARQIISELHVWRSGEAGSINGEENTRVVYPDLDPPPVPPDAGTVMHAGVLLGAAVAWIVMTDLQGGAS